MIWSSWIPSVVMFLLVFPIVRALFRYSWERDFGSIDTTQEAFAMSLFAFFVSILLGFFWPVPIILLVIGLIVLGISKIFSRLRLQFPNPYNFLGFKWLENRAYDIRQKARDL